MGIEVTCHKSVICHVKKFRKVRREARRAGGRRGDVNIENISRSTIKVGPNAVNLCCFIPLGDKIGGIKVDKGDIALN